MNEIVDITGRSKTSVYFHIKHIPLSTQKQNEIREHTKRRAIRAAASRKGKALRPHKNFDAWTPELILLCAHLMFDGEILNQRCVYNNRSVALIDRVQQLMRRVYQFEPNVHKIKQSGVIRIQYHNVELATYLHRKAENLIVAIPCMSLEYQREFLRAFFDDEGCMDFRPNRNLRRIRGYQKDKTILRLVQELLGNFKITSSLQGKNEIVISGKENLHAFRKEINFSKGVRLNPNRTNSIWKKDIEKRKLLVMAIGSFKS